MAIYVEYEGIAGTTTAKGFEKLMEVESFEFSAGRDMTQKTGAASERTKTKVHINEIVITKKTDPSVTSLFAEVTSGNKGKNVKIKFVKSEGNDLGMFMEYSLTDCLISNYSISCHGEDVMEQISISFTKIEVSYTGSDNNNKSSSPQRIGYNIAQGSKL